MADDAKPIEPWFFDLEAPCPLDDEDRDRITVLNAAGRAIVSRMVEHIAIDEDVPAEAMTPGFVDTAIDRVRDAIHEARRSGPKARPKTDIEELALRYMETMRLWLRIYGSARDRQAPG